MSLYVKGVTVPKLGSLQDRVIREYLSREADKEIKKVQLLALMVNSLTHKDDDRPISIFKKYLSLELGIEIPEMSDKEQQMLDYYQTVVKPMKPTITIQGKGDKRRLVVSGLDALMK